MADVVRLFDEFAGRRFIERFLNPHEASRQGPRTFKRREVALDEHHLQVFLVERKHDDIDGQRGTGELV